MVSLFIIIVMHNLFILLLLSIRVMFYNCENLLFSSGHTYEKLTNLSRVVVAAGEGTPPAIIGLAEVENDSIMQRWTTRTPLARWHYQYIITDSPDERGINVALMYQPDDYRLIGSESLRVDMPEGIRPTRDILHAWGRVIGGDTLDVVVCHLPSRYGGKKASDRARQIAHSHMRSLMDSICLSRQDPHLIVMGDFNDYPTTRQVRRDFSGYVNLMYPLQKSLVKGKLAYGSHKYAGEWGFLDQFIVNSSMVDNVSNCNVSKESSSYIKVRNPRAFAMPFMLVDDVTQLGFRPLRSRYGYKYEGGYSDHLPILLDVIIQKHRSIQKAE